MAEQQPAVSLPLLGSTRQVEGLILHEATHDLWLPTPEVLRPHRVAIHLPEGEPLTLTARAMIFLCRNGLIEGVYVRRPLEAVPFAQAVADLRRTIETLGLPDGDSLVLQIERWPEEAPVPDPGDEPPAFEAEAPVSDAVGLRVRVGPDPGGDGWYSLLLFDATAEARRAAHAAAGTSDAGPSRSEAVLEDQ